jgi:putative glycosyltransferase (TIGR04372 family)
MRKEYLSGKNRQGKYLLISGTPANCQLLRMIKRRYPVLTSDMIFSICANIKNSFSKSPLWLDLKSTGLHDYAIWANTPTQLSFTEDELRRGRELLESIGIPQSVSYLCFFARDKEYLDNIANHGTRRDWSYHDYRDCDIENFIAAVETVTGAELWALRMGAAVEKPIRSSNQRIIDYASDYHSEFADIYLLSHCKFTLGCSTGIVVVSEIFRIPCAIVNLVPLRHLPRNPGDLFLPKKLWNIGSKRFLTLRETIDIGADRWVLSSQYRAAGIELVENSPEEITAVSLEMNSRIDGTWKTTDEDEELQKRFWSIFPEGHPGKKCPARIGAEFLRKNRDCLA